ncbi:MAG: hypothetical protein JWR40_5009 [Massilia sp.]|nr:hypothetical protein [Massilia sp.]
MAVTALSLGSDVPLLGQYEVGNGIDVNCAQPGLSIVNWLAITIPVALEPRESESSIAAPYYVNIGKFVAYLATLHQPSYLRRTA